jgi:uncharacterized membrane protein
MLQVVLVVHIAAGSAALLSMFVPMLTRKGATLHRRAGWVFVSGMAIVSITAVILAVGRILSDPGPQARSFAIFLFYIAILTAAGVSTGVRVLRRRHGAPGWWDLGISSLLVAMALGMAVAALLWQTWLFAGFAAIGLASGGNQLAYWLRGRTHHMHWWFEHMGSMLGSCIAATTAFLVVNADRMGTSDRSLLVWLAPTLVGAPAIAVWTAYYRRRFASGAAARPDTLRSAPAAGPYTPSRSA